MARTCSNPTQRTLIHCRKLGWLPWVVERRIAMPDNPWGNLKDLYGGIDVVAMDQHAGLIGIQASSRAMVAPRQRKLEQLDDMREWLRRGLRLEVWGWDQPNGKGTSYRVRRVRAKLEAGEIHWEEVA